MGGIPIERTNRLVYHSGIEILHQFTHERILVDRLDCSALAYLPLLVCALRRRIPRCLTQREIEPDPRNCFGVEASRDHSQVIEIWRMF